MIGIILGILALGAVIVSAVYNKKCTEQICLDHDRDMSDLILENESLRDELIELKAEFSPIQEFMNEHRQNILEAEEEYARQQKMITDGIASIANYSKDTAMGKANKPGDKQ